MEKLQEIQIFGGNTKIYKMNLTGQSIYIIFLDICSECICLLPNDTVYLPLPFTYFTVSQNGFFDKRRDLFVKFESSILLLAIPLSVTF